jgi:hypothetical protein
MVIKKTPSSISLNKFSDKKYDPINAISSIIVKLQYTIDNLFIKSPHGYSYL